MDKGKYIGDEKTIIKKAEIGRLQLEAAIQMFLEEQYFAAITLAGAADGIFCGLIESENRLTPGDETWAQIEELRARGIQMAGRITKREAYKKWNAARNSLKHHSGDKDGEYLEIFPIDEAYEWIERAKVSGKELSIEAENYHDFEARVIPWFFL